MTRITLRLYRTGRTGERGKKRGRHSPCFKASPQLHQTKKKKKKKKKKMEEKQDELEDFQVADKGLRALFIYIYSVHT